MAIIHGNFGVALHSTQQDVQSEMWLLDSGATDHMTFTATDFSQISLPQHSSIANANGVMSPVTEAGIVTLSPSLQLQNTLLVPSLSHKLLSVSQLATDLNCAYYSILIFVF